MKQALEKLQRALTVSADLILEFLLPEPDAVREIRLLSPAELTAISGRAEPSKETDLVLFRYRTEEIRTLIWEIKYRGNDALVSLACAALFDVLIGELAEERMWENFTDPLLIPMPISKQRKRERGFNQCELLGEALARLDEGRNFSYRPDILKKVRHTESQTTSSREARLKNLQGCFAVNGRDAVRGRNIILLDDVVTTGATLHEAKRALKAAGARRVFAVALAH